MGWRGTMNFVGTWISLMNLMSVHAFEEMRLPTHPVAYSWRRGPVTVGLVVEERAAPDDRLRSCALVPRSLFCRTIDAMSFVAPPWKPADDGI